VPEVVAKLRASRLGAVFAAWVERNWKRLIAEPRLKDTSVPGTKSAGGGAAGTQPTTSNEPLKTARRIQEKSTAAKPQWTLGSGKSAQKWQNQMQRRGWTPQQIDDAMANGQQFPAVNNLNPAHSATRYINPQTGRSVVVDDATHEVIHVGGDGFKY
jgi:hypothetical protein